MIGDSATKRNSFSYVNVVKNKSLIVTYFAKLQIIKHLIFEFSHLSVAIITNRLSFEKMYPIAVSGSTVRESKAVITKVEREWTFFYPIFYWIK